ncbi:MAG: carboxypeptidase-like regulatory domain-containing protein, partial [Bacteroidales bacterium]|nr:carboxypeptidase-like regulatory domain-containing protein [Bacteroidales bacterium]
MKKTSLLLLLGFFSLMLSAQSTITQTIRGTVIDKITLTPLPGANVILLNSDPLVGVSADVDGKFRLEKVPIGRVDLKVTYIGYKDIILSGLNLQAGKELVLDLKMDEMAVMSEEVVVTAKREKAKAINDMATVSARGFTVEETERYAGSRNDVA